MCLCLLHRTSSRIHSYQHPVLWTHTESLNCEMNSKNAFNWIFPEKNVQNHSSSLLLLILLTHRLGNCFWNQRISIRYNVDKGTMARCGSIKIILMTFTGVESKSSSLPYHEWLWFLFIYSVVAVKDEESVAYVTGTLAQLLLYLLLTSPSS